MPRITAFVLLLGVGLNLLSCTKKIDGNTSFKEATKGFQKELTKDQRKSAIEQLQTETAGLHTSLLVGEFLFDALPCARPEVPAVIVFAALQFLGLLQ
jgi:hypothetical protein